MRVIERMSDGRDRLKTALKERANAPQGLTLNRPISIGGLAVNATRTCSIDGCKQRYRSGGYCSTHLREARVAGTVKDLRLAVNRDPLPIVMCRVDGCDSEAKYRGQALCGKHHLRRWTHGSFDLPAKPTLRELLDAGIGPNRPEGACWLWQGAIADTGYGRISSLYAHRVSYEEHVGPIPEGLQIDHLCRVRACVNPSHLEPVTQLENLRREQAAKNNRCKRGHSLDNAYIRPDNGHRMCRACQRERGRTK